MFPAGVATDYVAVLATMDPDVTTASTVVTPLSNAYIKADEFHLYKAIIFTGTLGASATVDAKIEYSLTGSGAATGDVTGLAITQMTQAGTDQSDDQAVINIRPGDLAGFGDYFRLSVTVGTQTSDVGAVILGIGPRYGPASDFDSATVGEIVTL